MASIFKSLERVTSGDKEGVGTPYESWTQTRVPLLLQSSQQEVPPTGHQTGLLLGGLYLS